MGNCVIETESGVIDGNVTFNFAPILRASSDTRVRRLPLTLDGFVSASLTPEGKEHLRSILGEKPMTLLSVNNNDWQFVGKFSDESEKDGVVTVAFTGYEVEAI